MPGGAWGLKLFQSDYDYDIIQFLDGDAGLCELEQADAEANGGTALFVAAWAKDQANGQHGLGFRQFVHGCEEASRPQRLRTDLHYSVYAKTCSHPKRVRDYLDSSGVLLELIAAYMTNLRVPLLDVGDAYRPGYMVVLLSACAMTLGCKLPEEFLRHVRATYDNPVKVGLMRDAFPQMRKALFGPDRYVNGVPHDFGSEGLSATMRNGLPPAEDAYLPFTKMFNVPSPIGVETGGILQTFKIRGNFPTIKATREYIEKRYEQTRAQVAVVQYDHGMCGYCGSEKGMDGGSLLECAKCRSKTYCGRECQKKHWSEHKVVCKVPGMVKAQD